MDIEKVKNIIRECIEAVSSGVPNCRLVTEMLGQVLEELEKETMGREEIESLIRDIVNEEIENHCEYWHYDRSCEE